MSLTSNFDKLSKKSESKAHADTSPARNIVFTLPDYTQTFLSYGYLVSGSFLPDDGSIVLCFTTHTVTISGYNLEGLFQGIIDQRIGAIAFELERHVAAADKETDVILTDIKISKV